MSHQDLRDKYRPQTFGEVVGNQRTIKILINMIQKRKVPPGILFHGPAGSGKTTLARLLVKALACLSFTKDICGICINCTAFTNSPSSFFDYHDCTKVSGREIDWIIENLKKQIFLELKGFHLRILVFDEFHRSPDRIQDKFLTPLEGNGITEGTLLIFCVQPTIHELKARVKLGDTFG